MNPSRSPATRLALATACSIAVAACDGSSGTGAGPAAPPEEWCSTPATALRRPISPDSPLFVFNIYGGAPSVSRVDAVLPPDVRPYFALHHVPAAEYDGGEAYREAVESVLEESERIDIPTFVQIDHCYTRNPLPESYWADLYERFESFVGVIFAELSCSTLQLNGLDADYAARIARALETAAAHGGYVLWQDMSWDRPGPWKRVPHVFIKAGADEGLQRTIREHGAHLILQDKKNGDGRRFSTTAAALGQWATCGIGQWGVHPEDWMWKESGFRRLYRPSPGWTPWYHSWEQNFTYPEALFGLEWLVGMAAGATVYSLEAPAHGFADLSTGRTTPAFDQVLLPLVRHVLSLDLIPTRGEVQAEMKVAYQPTVPAPPEINGDDLFRGLYGPERRSLDEWLPSSGRYYFLPVLPVLAGPEDTAPFPVVFDDAEYAAELADVEAKVAFFDRSFPVRGEGDAWFVNVGARWYLANPNENADVTTTFSFALARRPRLRLAGSLPPHTFAFVLEEADGLRLHVSNYRTDSDADVWGNPDLVRGDVGAFLRNTYLDDPTDEALRRTTIRLEGLRAEPRVDLAVHDGARADGRHDAEARTWRLTLDHNGPVDLTLSYPD